MGVKKQSILFLNIHVNIHAINNYLGCETMNTQGRETNKLLSNTQFTANSFQSSKI